MKESTIEEVLPYFLENKKIKFGINEVYKFINKTNLNCYVLIANDTFPKEIVNHIRKICTLKNIKYSDNFSKNYLGKLANLKQTSCCVFIGFENDNEREKYLLSLENNKELFEIYSKNILINL